MEAFNECSICNEPFQFATISRQAICLPCGHSTCRSCLSRIPSAHCPTCRSAFTADVAAMAPNYDLHQVLAATSSSSGSTLDAIASHTAVISAQVAVLQLDNTRRDVAATATHKKLHDMFLLMQQLCGQLQSQPRLQPAQQHQHQPYQIPQRVAQHTVPPTISLHDPVSAIPTLVEQQQLQQQQQQQQQQSPQQQWAELRQLQRQSQVQPSLQQPATQQPATQQPATQQPTTQQPATIQQPPPGFPLMSTPCSAAAAQLIPAATPVASRSTSGTHNASSSGNIIPTPAPSNTVYVDSNSLGELFLKINFSTASTTFDLGGRTLQHCESDLPASSMVVTVSNITIRNGTIQQPESSDRNSPGLHIQGTNINLEGLTFMGGGYGVLVLPGASVKMFSCAVIGAFFGVGVGEFNFGKSGVDVSKLEARDVKVSGCGRRGLTIGRGGQANVRRSEFINGLHCGIFVSGDSASKLVAADVRCSGNKQRGLCVVANGTALLSRCIFTGNAGGCMFVQDPLSLVKHARCVFDAEPLIVNNATVQELKVL